MAIGVKARDQADVSGSIYDDPEAYAEAFGKNAMPAKQVAADNGEWSAEIIADPAHPMFAEHKRRFEAWQDRQWDC